MATGPMAEALTRDLLSDGLAFDSLGWYGLWCYITQAPPQTALHAAQNDGWDFTHHILAEVLYEARKLGWRYTAVHFKGGSTVAFPEPIYRPGVEPPEKTEYTAADWAEVESIEDLIPPEVRELLRG